MGILLIYGGLIFLVWLGFYLKNQELEKKDREMEYRAQYYKEEAKRIHEQLLTTDPLYQKRYKEEQEHINRQREEQVRKAAEEKRLAEERRKGELKAKFHYINIGGNKAAYCYDYYPKNRYPYVDYAQESNRRAIWNFKNGSYFIGVRIISDFLEGNCTYEQFNNIALCVIPASTKLKNDMRYKNMCYEVTSKYPIVNGFNYISICYDRDDSREQKCSNTIENLIFSDKVYGKEIILFDDITTRGTSFIQVAQALKAKGAKSVYGIFIGRTVNEF